MTPTDAQEHLRQVPIVHTVLYRGAMDYVCDLDEYARRGRSPHEYRVKAVGLQNHMNNARGNNNHDEILNLLPQMRLYYTQNNICWRS